ncbi:MAG: hypothetical protein ACYDAM_12205 [Leptospirales bacterium]
MNKDDANDAQAICEASHRPSIPTVPVKAEQEQDLQSLHRARRLPISFRVQRSTISGEFCRNTGLSWAPFPKKVKEALDRLLHDPETPLSPSLKERLRAHVPRNSGD